MIRMMNALYRGFRDTALLTRLTTYLLLRAAGAAQIAAVEADDVRARAAEEVDRLQTELDRVKQWVGARDAELTDCIHKLERTIQGGTCHRTGKCVKHNPSMS